jgi:hypothetical protein
MRNWILMACLLLCGWAQAAPAVYKRGDFQFSVGAEPEFVQHREIPAQWEPTAPGAKDAPWRFWLYDKQADRRRGREQLYIDYVYEAKSPSLLGDAGRYQLEFNPGYQQLTIHRVEIRRDGTWQNRLDPDRISLARRETDFDRDMTDGEVTALIVLDDIRVDDVVRVAFTITGSNPILAGHSIDSMAFAWIHPMLDSHLRVLADAGTAFDVHRENGAPEPVRMDTAAGSEIAFDVHAAPVVIDEGNYPVWFQPYPLALVSARRSWKDVVAWALPLYPQADALPADLEARIRTWSALATPNARLTAALRAVQDEVRYFGVEMGENTHRPASPADTWQRRRGDCKDKAYLLSTILRRLGIDSAPALTSMGRGRALLDYPPSAAAFDHVIVRAVLAGKPLWVDPTMSQTGGDPARIDLSRSGAALPISAGAAALETVAAPAAAATGVEVAEHLAPTAGGKVALEVTSVYRGAAANNTRQNFAGRRRGDISRKYSDFYRKRYGDLEVVSEPSIRDERDTNVVTVVEEYLLDGPFDSDDASTRAIDLYADAIATPAALPSSMSRVGPLFIATPGEYRHWISIAVPSDWRPTFETESERHKASAFDFTRELKLEDGNATLDYDLVVHQYDVMPAAAAAQIQELRKVNDSLSSRLRYSVPTHLDDGERSRRLKRLLQDVMDQGASK